MGQSELRGEEMPFIDCGGCMKNVAYQKTLATFLVTDKRLQQKASKYALYRNSLLADITNFVVKKLD